MFPVGRPQRGVEGAWGVQRGAGKRLAGVRGGAGLAGANVRAMVRRARNTAPGTRSGCAGHEITVRRARSGAGAGLRPETAVSGRTHAQWTGAPYP